MRLVTAIIQELQLTWKYSCSEIVNVHLGYVSKSWYRQAFKWTFCCQFILRLWPYLYSWTSGKVDRCIWCWNFPKRASWAQEKSPKKLTNTGGKISLLIGLPTLVSQKLGWRDNQSNVWRKLPCALWCQIGLWGVHCGPHNKRMLMALAQCLAGCKCYGLKFSQVKYALNHWRAVMRNVGCQLDRT